MVQKTIPTLDEWLDYLEKLHPAAIELGLDRVTTVAERLSLDFTGTKIVTVAGTNGKGSCITLLDSILRAAGYRTGAYTSPHLLRYNERVCIDGRQLSDSELCEAFEAVEAAREGTSLTYFEFGTLAALWHFSRESPDYLLLEVGLGGRLDAVNIVNPDVALITNVALDHMDWLGNTRESIGKEKAGILREGKPAVYGEIAIPASVEHEAKRLGVKLLRQGQQFRWNCEHENSRWHWQGINGKGEEVYFDSLPDNRFALDNMAAAIQALVLLEPDLDRQIVMRGLETASLAGRFQTVSHEGCSLLLDVAHNPHAAARLAANLESTYPGCRLRIVIAMLGDKDSAGVLECLQGLPVDGWYVGEIHGDRGSPSKIIYNQLVAGGEARATAYACVEDAFNAALSDAVSGEIVVVTGSFFTVSAVLELIERAQVQGRDCPDPGS